MNVLIEPVKSVVIWDIYKLKKELPYINVWARVKIIDETLLTWTIKFQEINNKDELIWWIQKISYVNYNKWIWQ